MLTPHFQIDIDKFLVIPTPKIARNLLISIWYQETQVRERYLTNLQNQRTSTLYTEVATSSATLDVNAAINAHSPVIHSIATTSIATRSARRFFLVGTLVLDPAMMSARALPVKSSMAGVVSLIPYHNHQTLKRVQESATGRDMQKVDTKSMTVF